MDKSEKIKEMIELINIPEVERFLFSALEEAKLRYSPEIQQYLDERDEASKSKDKIPPPDLSKFSSEKSYFFDLNRIDSPERDSGYKWVVESFKFKNDPNIIDYIFTKFLKEIDHIEIDPQKIETHTIQSDSGLTIEINYYKTSQTHVGGFIKAYPQEEKKNKDDSTVIRTTREYNEKDKNEMYEKIRQLMDDNPEARKNFFLYYEMIQRSKE